jgi:hypothetical protein
MLAVSSSCSDALDGSVFASIPFDRETIECLRQRTQCFLKAKDVYAELYETYEFLYLPEWYDTGAVEKYEDQLDRAKLERLVNDSDACDEELRAQLDRLEACEMSWLVLPTDELPASGNLRTECDQLVMSLRGDTYDTVELRWICYLKHTDVELRTFDISSEDVDRWLDEVQQGDQHGEEATRSST